MKTLRLLAAASITLLTMSFSCGDKDGDAQPCDGTAATLATQAFALPTGCAVVAQRGEAKQYSINSAAELSAAIQCGGTGTVPPVDFAAYTVLAGRVPRSGGASLRAQAVTQDCQGNYIHTVSVADGPTLSPTDVDYTLLVPKLRSGRSVSVVVNVVP